jgi:RND family efflux transporter MFP subunit
MAPVYGSFTGPQENLPEIRRAIGSESAMIEASIPGEQKRATGQVSMIENSVDPATGMATVRATMPNKDELLWPGTLVTVDLTLRTEEAVVVPTNAIQVSQSGSIVFVVSNGVAKVRHVKIERQVDDETVVTSGLTGGEKVVVDGQLLLRDGTRVTLRSGETKPKPIDGS